MPNTLQITTRGDREIVITRAFDAPRTLVWEAFTKPEFVRQWLLGPPGWTMPVCEIDFRVGGHYRYVWRSPDGMEMGMSGVHREIVIPERIISTERFDQSWYPGEAIGTITLAEQGERTMLSQIVQYESREARDVVLKSPMESGLAAGYDRLERLAASILRGEKTA